MAQSWSRANPRGSLPFIVSSHNLSAILFDATASQAVMRAVSPQSPSSRNNGKSHGPTQPCREVDEQQLLESLAESQGLEHKK